MNEPLHCPACDMHGPCPGIPAHSTSEGLDVERLNKAITGHQEFARFGADFDHRCSGACAGSIASEYAALHSEDEG